MKKIRIRRLLLTFLCGALLAGCAIRPDRHPSSATLYDFGPLHTAPARMLPAGFGVSVAEVSTPSWLDSPAMFYRLAYANAQQPRPYAQSRWVTPPAQLFGQRLKARISQAGGIAALATDAPTNLSMLRLETDDFMQVFDAPDKSHGRVAMRASVFTGRTLIAQKSFSAQAASPGNDAASGVMALTAASDAVIDEMMAWLATLPLKHP